MEKAKHTGGSAVIREQENLYQVMFEQTSTALLVFNEDMTLFLVNRAFVKLSGYSKEELEGKKKWTEFVAEKDLMKTKEYSEQHIIDPDVAPRTDEFQFLDKWGNPKEALVHFIKFPELKKTMAILTDISEQKQAEEDLRTSLQKLQEIIEFLPDATFVIDDQKRVIAWNRALEEMSGVNKEAILGKGDYAYSVPFYGR
ncbi:MAG: PAS domain S-box protein, partial [Heliobacteriaceae bacterium]|nr:PAS domain S-box protein [Heliobacteriaceae bacterium]